jgi:hypothetical protein
MARNDTRIMREVRAKENRDRVHKLVRTYIPGTIAGWVIICSKCLSSQCSVAR